MPKKNADQTLADSPAEQVVDESLGDVETPDLEPETFDFAEWLNGLRPLTVKYTLPGGRATFLLQARTHDFLRENALVLKDGEAIPDDYALRLLAAHIVSPEGVAVADLEKIRDTPGYQNDVQRMVLLAQQLTIEPSAINAAFLLDASD